MTGNYILAADGRTPIPEPDIIAWATWYGTADRVVAQDRVEPYFVSTVFLGVDHNFAMRGRPILWETMIFSGRGTISQGRYSTYEEAARGHQHIVGKVRRAAAQ